MFVINVGDVVGFAYFSFGGRITSNGTAVVAKINRWGHILLENGRLFDKFGNEKIQTGVSRIRLIEVALLERELAAQACKAEGFNAHRRATELLKDARGYNCVHLSAEDKAELIALIETFGE